MIWELTMLAKLLQQFQPIGAAPKEAVANTKNSHDERINRSLYLGRLSCAYRISTMQNYPY